MLLNREELRRLAKQCSTRSHGGGDRVLAGAGGYGVVHAGGARLVSSQAEINAIRIAEVTRTTDVISDSKIFLFCGSGCIGYRSADRYRAPWPHSAGQHGKFDCCARSTKSADASKRDDQAKKW